MSVLKQLKSLEIVTTTDKTLANFILNNPEKIHKMTLQQFADHSFVSKPTTIRFIHRLGYESFRDFKLALQVELERNKDLSSIDSNYPFKNKDSNMQIVEKLAKVVKQVADHSLNSIDPFILKNVVNTIYNSKRIYIFAVGNCFIESQILVNRLARLNRTAILINTFAYPYNHILNLEETDCVLILSATGKTLKIEKRTVNLLRKSKAKTILLSGDHNTELHKQYDYVLVAFSGEDALFKNETFASQTSILLLLNIIYACLFERDYEENSKKNLEIAQMISDHYL